MLPAIDSFTGSHLRKYETLSPARDASLISMSEMRFGLLVFFMEDMGRQKPNRLGLSSVIFKNKNQPNKAREPMRLAPHFSQGPEDFSAFWPHGSVCLLGLQRFLYAFCPELSRLCRSLAFAV